MGPLQLLVTWFGVFMPYTYFEAEETIRYIAELTLKREERCSCPKRLSLDEQKAAIRETSCVVFNSCTREDLNILKAMYDCLDEKGLCSGDPKFNQVQLECGFPSSCQADTEGLSKPCKKGLFRI